MHRDHWFSRTVQALSEHMRLARPSLVRMCCVMTFVRCVQVKAAEEQSKPVILINPILKDLPGAGGVMGIRGRDVRLAFEDSFVVAYHFRLLYFSGFIYPIMGALRFSFGEKWQVRTPLASTYDNLLARSVTWCKCRQLVLGGCRQGDVCSLLVLSIAYV